MISVKLPPKKMLEVSAENGVAIKFLQDWCDDNLQGGWYEEWTEFGFEKENESTLWSTPCKIYHFENEHDAMLFKLTFL